MIVTIRQEKRLSMLFVMHVCEKRSLCFSAPTLCTYEVFSALTPENKKRVSVQCDPKIKASRAIQKAFELGMIDLDHE